MLSRKLVAAVLRVVICLPPTLTLFKFLKRRYLSSQIDELNGVCKWRGQMVRASESKIICPCTDLISNGTKHVVKKACGRCVTCCHLFTANSNFV